MLKLLSFFSILISMSCISCNAHAGIPSARLRNEMSKVVEVSVSTKADDKGNRGRILATGFPVDRSHFITAGHFCNSVAILAEAGQLDNEFVDIIFINGNDEYNVMHGAEIQYYEFSDTQDLCVIRLEKHGIRPVTLGNYADVKVGDRVFLSGAPHGVFPVITDGYVSRKLTNNMSTAVLNGKMIFSTAATHGNSGGCIFNLKGEVIGVVVMKHPNYDHATIGVTGDDLVRFIEKYVFD